MNDVNILVIAIFTFLFFYVKILTIYFVQSVHIAKLDNLKRRAKISGMIENKRIKGLTVNETIADIFLNKLE